MLCENYREELTAAAGEGAVLSPQLRAHVASCPGCRAFLREEQQLFAAIDSSVCLAANTEVPATLLPRVRVKLNEQASSRKFWVATWVMATAATALIAVVVAFRARHHEAQPQSPVSSQVARAVVPAESSRTPDKIAAQMQSKATARHKTLRRTETSSPTEKVAVLVPSGQKAAVDNLIFNLRRGQVEGANLVAKESEAPLEELRIRPIEVSPIVVKPLEEVGGEAPELKKETTR